MRAIIYLSGMYRFRQGSLKNGFCNHGMALSPVISVQRKLTAANAGELATVRALKALRPARVPAFA